MTRSAPNRPSSSPHHPFAPSLHLLLFLLLLIPILLPARARAAGASAPATHHVRLTLPQPPDAPTRAALEKADLTLLDPISPGVFFATAPADLDPATLKPLDAATQPIDPADKLHPLFKAPDLPSWAALGKDSRGRDITAAIVLFHADEPLGAQAIDLITRHDGIVRTEFMFIRGVLAELPADALPALAAEDAVMWIEPPIPALESMNASTRIITQVDTVQAAPYGLSGDGVEVLVYDAGRIRPSHRDLVGRIAPLDTTPMNYHATHVAGTIGGTGAASEGENRGMAPAVHFFSAGYQAQGGSVILHTDPGDLEADYGLAQAAKGPGRLISSNSIGSNIATNGFDCSLHGDYGATSAIIDAVVNGAAGEPMIIAWAGSNERSAFNCPGPYSTIAPPSTAKNPIIVGAVNSNDDSMTDFSSWGPNDDGRLAPTLVAPGCQSDGDLGVTSTSVESDSAYRVLCGTSMATPVVAGISALILEDWRAQYPSLPDPRNADIKMILAHTAVDLGSAGPDYSFGYGSVRAADAIDFLRAGRFASAALTGGEAASFLIDVPPGASPLKLTLAWDDAPGTVGAPAALVNDLDLRVTAPGGAQHYPWTLDPANPAASAVRTQQDHVNNIEQVVVDAPAPGQWLVEVVGTNIPVGPQRFSLGSSVELNLPSLQIFLPDGLPEAIAPSNSGGPEGGIPVRIAAQSDLVDPASAIVAYRTAGSAAPFATAPLAHTTGDDYLATIPAPACGPDLEIFFAAAGLSGAVATNPAEAPALDGTGPVGPGHTYTLRIGQYETRFHDDFETDTGWTVENGAVADGGWDRGVPVGGGTRGDPPTDADGSGGDGTGFCWLTDNVAGNSDLDGGPTILISPTLDASGARDARVSYWRWYSTVLGAAPLEDAFLVEVSADDGQTWTTLEEIDGGGADGGGGWHFARLDLDEAIPLTSTMRIRFIADDIGAASIIEAGIDGVTLETFTCGDPAPACPCELTGDDTLDVFDLLAYLDLWFASDPAADLNNTANVDVFDLLTYLDCWFQACP